MKIAVHTTDPAPGFEYAVEGWWQVTRAILEGVEEGSSKHCLLVELIPNGKVITHYRLGLVITVTWEGFTRPPELHEWQYIPA